MREILENIRANDPDGWTSEPTESDYRLFKAWVLVQYGQNVWDTYHTNWDQ